MNDTLRIGNARIVTADAIIQGGLVAEHGVIQEIVPDARSAADVLYFGGDYLLPGLVELHTDNL
jgi:alpha-D-ribose 1-methylphosphonate 5-triphosphate diphosphatase